MCVCVCFKGFQENNKSDTLNINHYSLIFFFNLGNNGLKVHSRPTELYSKIFVVQI